MTDIPFNPPAPPVNPADPLQVPAPPIAVQPYVLPDHQQYAIDQERMRHNEAVYRFGEYSIFVLMWTFIDFDNGLVQRCPVCYTSAGATADAYGQSTKAKCPNCYGTTFDGGIKARIVRPALWTTSTADSVEPSRRGEVIRNNAQVQSTSDFVMNFGDYVFKADNTRWRVAEAPTEINIETGFVFSTDPRTLIAANYARLSREDQSSVAFIIPPTDPTDLMSLLDLPNPRVPVDFSSIEVINGPLIGSEEPE